MSWSERLQKLGSSLEAMKPSQNSMLRVGHTTSSLREWSASAQKGVSSWGQKAVWSVVFPFSCGLCLELCWQHRAGSKYVLSRHHASSNPNEAVRIWYLCVCGQVVNIRSSISQDGHASELYRTWLWRLTDHHHISLKFQSNMSQFQYSKNNAKAHPIRSCWYLVNVSAGLVDPALLPLKGSAQYSRSKLASS